MNNYADYILGAVLIICFVLAARSYFGKKFGGDCSGCSGCPHAQKCLRAKLEQKRKD